MEKYKKELLTFLKAFPKGATSEAIAVQLGVSSKTIQNCIKELNQLEVEQGWYVETKKGRGLKLIVTDEHKFNQVDRNIEGQQESLEQLIELLIHQDNYLKSEEICERLFISASKLSSELKKMRRILSLYHLSLDSKPYHGIKILGNEFDFRRFLASNYVQKYHVNYRDDSIDVFDEEKSEFFEVIRTIISEEFSKKAYPISDNILNNLTHHLQIAIVRMQEGLYLKNNQLNASKFNDEHELLGQKIVARLEKVGDVHFSENERNYVISQIVGKRMASKDETQVVSSEVTNLVDEVLRKIKASRQIDLLHDLDLRTMLILHFAPLIDRLELGIELKNPLLNEVKIYCTVGYDLAIIASQAITQKFEKQLSDHELSYLSMHFDVALNRNNNVIRKKRLLLITDGGRSTGELLKVKFERYFQNHLELLDLCDHLEYQKFLRQKNYDFVFTTRPIAYQGDISIFNIEYFLQPETVKKITQVLTEEIGLDDLDNYFDEALYFPNQNFKSKEEILRFLCQKVRESREMPKSFERLIDEREAFFGTDFLPNVAFPHPNELISPQTTIAVLTLKKPIFWYKHSVRIIFMVLISKNDHLKVKPLTEKMIHLCNAPEKLQKMIQTKKLSDFLITIKESN